MLRHSVETYYAKLLPHGEGFLLNDVPAKLEYVARSDYRVDLVMGSKAAFLVEHLLGCALLAGITSARIYGASKDYDPSRQSFRDAKEKGFPPSTVLGNPHGTLDRELYEKLVAAKAETRSPPPRVSIAEEVQLSYPEGRISIRPSDGLEIIVAKGALHYEFAREEAKKIEIAEARTPYLGGLTEETIPHVVGDIIGDIWGIGGINCARIEIEPGREYHRLTIGALRKVKKVLLD